LNCKYNAERLRRYRAFDATAEIVVALGTSTAIGSWAVWKTSFGNNGWTVLAAVAVVFSIVKPILQLAKSIEKYGRLYSGYSSLSVSFRFLTDEIRLKRSIDESLLKTINGLFEQIRELAKDDDPAPSRRLLERLYAEVNNEFPPASLWMPRPAMEQADV
jgi:hypothetical protein